MAKKQAYFVSADSCARAALVYGLEKALQTSDRGLLRNKTVLADAMEAVLGAIYLDFGYEHVKNLIFTLWKEIFENYNETEVEYKTQLQELCQSRVAQTPVYEVTSISGPAHKPEFTIMVTALGRTATATGSSKKEAETKAAKLLFKELSNI
jgi:ribonuclease-3